MSVPAPTRFFDANTRDHLPLDISWAHLQDDSICRPWMVQVFNLRLSDFVAAPASLADLAFPTTQATRSERQRPRAIVGLLTTLPSKCA